MTRNGYRLHDAESAPGDTKVHFEHARRKFGFVPNLLRLMAESPTTLKSYLAMDEMFFSGSLATQEALIVQLTASVENGCKYCTAAHSMQCLNQGIDPAVVTAVRQGTPVPDARLRVLSDMVRHLIERRGAAEEAYVDAFLAAGFTREQLLDVVLGLAVKTISNYTNNIVGAPVDEVFAAQRVDETEA